MSRRQAQQARRERDKTRQEQFIADLTWLMDAPQGRRVMHWILELGHIHHSSFRTSAEMPFLEGERNLALKVFAQVRAHCLPQYLDMEREAADAAVQAARVEQAITERDVDD